MTDKRTFIYMYDKLKSLILSDNNLKLKYLHKILTVNKLHCHI